jgi:hypothetical protein
MGYIDIWGFIEDNSDNLKEEIGYMEDGNFVPAYSKLTALEETNELSKLSRYLPPMHAIVLKLNDGAEATKSLDVTLNTSRIVTEPVSGGGGSAPNRHKSVTSDSHSAINKGIMTVTAVNPVSSRCTSRLYLGQGYHAEIISGEDALLTTVNIDNFSMTSTPTTPFNIYAVEGTSGLSANLRDKIVNVPVSFYMSDLPYEPNTYLWFTGVNNIDGELVLYDALTDTERKILDGICLEIETPEVNHEQRYYIRRPGYNPNDPEVITDPEQPIATGNETVEKGGSGVLKLVKNGHVFVLRDGHVYTIYGQQVR